MLFQSLHFSLIEDEQIEWNGWEFVCIDAIYTCSQLIILWTHDFITNLRFDLKSSISVGLEELVLFEFDMRVPQNCAHVRKIAYS